jgi:hypothetical protein
MKQPLMFRRLLCEWTAMLKLLDDGMLKGFAGLSPEPRWVPLKGLSAISDAFPPQAYANPGWAHVYNKQIMRFRRREAFNAFWSGVSKSELEARLETYAQLFAALAGQAPPRSPFPFSSSGAPKSPASNEVGEDVWLP